jgi:hypothetical protein
MNTQSLNVRKALTVKNSRKPLDSALQAQLFKAVRAGDSQGIPALIKQGADPNAIGPDGFNALHLACHAKNKATAAQLIETLVKCGANINVPCVRGGTAQTHLRFSGMEFKAIQQLWELTKRLGADHRITSLACSMLDPVKHCPGLRREKAEPRAAGVSGYVVVREFDQTIRGAALTKAKAEGLAFKLTAKEVEDGLAAEKGGFHTVLPATGDLVRKWRNWLWEKKTFLVEGEVMELAVIDRVGFGGVA